MGKKIWLMVFLGFMIAANCFSQEVSNIPSDIKTPDDLVKWYANEFEYRMELWDDWQAPVETVATKTGDCEDFAYLTHAALKDLGVENNVYVLNFRGIKTKHAICIFKEKDGTYSIISNKEIFKTREADLKVALKRYYPDCNKFTVAKNFK